jgi:hypothetical protein
MSTPKTKPSAPRRSVQPAAAKPRKTPPSAQLRAQTRKVLGKHYRAKYGVR